jgi:hypothetical protein
MSPQVHESWPRLSQDHVLGQNSSTKTVSRRDELSVFQEALGTTAVFALLAPLSAGHKEACIVAPPS